MDRIDSNELGIDDVVIDDVDMLRVERMTNHEFWLAAYRGNSREVFRFYIEDGIIKCSHEHDK